MLWVGAGGPWVGRGLWQHQAKIKEKKGDQGKKCKGSRGGPTYVKERKNFSLWGKTTAKERGEKTNATSKSRQTTRGSSKVKTQLGTGEGTGKKPVGEGLESNGGKKRNERGKTGGAQQVLRWGK